MDIATNTLRSNFEPAPQYLEILSQSDRYAREQLYPLQQRMDDEEHWPQDLFQHLARDGYLGITLPEKFGGAGMDLFAFGMILQSISKWNPAVALSLGAHENLCANNILRNGSPDQCQRLLPRLCDGSAVGALALTEPGAGSDALGGMRSTAIRDGDHYVLNGRKLYITNGPIADLVLVYAKTAPDLGAKGISAFVVEKGCSGFTTGQKFSKMGYRGSPTGELIFDDCRVPAENRLGEENAGVGIVMSGLDLERAIFSVSSVAMAERALELAVDYAKSRRQFGQPIADCQMIRDKLASMYTTLESMRALVYKALATCEGLPRGAGGRGEIHKLTAAAILHAAQGAKQVIDDALQIHGGSGFIWESEINRLYRAAKLAEIGAGTNEVRKLIISEELLRNS